MYSRRNFIKFSSLSLLNLLWNSYNKINGFVVKRNHKTKKLISKFGILNKLTSFHQHNSINKIPFIVDTLKKRKSVALVSDAGMPSICDPGENLIQKVRENNFDVISSTLGISRWKDMSQINRSGEYAASKYPELIYWTFNWRKENGSQNMIETSKDEQFYMQEYCGCV